MWSWTEQDSTVKVWDVVLGTALYTLSSHQRAVTCVRWGGSNLIYSSSQDSTIKVWRADDVRTHTELQAHACTHMHTRAHAYTLFQSKHFKSGLRNVNYFQIHCQ